MWLTQQEVCELTGRKRKKSQRKALNQMAIVHKIRADGCILVLKSHVEKVMGGQTSDKDQRRKEPNWDAIRA